MKSWRRHAVRVLGAAIVILVTRGAVFPASGPLTGVDVQPEMSPLRPATPEVTGAAVLAKLIEHNHLRDAQLERYSAVRTYQVASDKGKIYATEVVRMRYLAPNHKHFSIDSATGSWLMRNLVLKRLIDSEADAVSPRAHRRTALKPANYSFKMMGQQDVGPYPCYVVQAIPKRQDKRLFEGTIWINTQDYGVVRIAGQPAAKLSFWIESARFVRQYQRIGEFWLPWKDQSTVHVRFAGVKILTIVHQQYTVNGRSASDGTTADRSDSHPTSPLSLLPPGPA
jgi:hypothetical protein